MKKKLILITILVIISSSADVMGFDLAKDHTGRYCAACHAVESCSGNCHAEDNEPSYSGRHIGQEICSRCHGEKINNPDVHAVHGKKNCSACHSSAGWNSTIAKIPPSGGSGDSMVIPKRKDCGYCHAFNNNRLLHGIHQPFLVEEKCPKCHGQIYISPDDIRRISGKEPRASSAALESIGINPEIKEAVMAPIKILSDFFNSIANIWMDILT